MAEISSTGDQMLTVLETVAREAPVNAAEVARRCDINRTVAHRLLTTLAQRAYVRRSEKGYTLGPAALQLSRSVDVDIHRIAKPIMTRLAQEIGETVVLHAIDNFEAVVIEQALGQKHLVRVEHSPGSRHPLNMGASGWSLLAFQHDKLIARLLRKVENPDAVSKRIEQTRKEGYSISHDELQLGVHGLAVPVVERNGRCQVSVGILVPSVRASTLPPLLPQLLACARHVASAVDNPVPGTV